MAEIYRIDSDQSEYESEVSSFDSQGWSHKVQESDKNLHRASPEVSLEMSGIVAAAESSSSDLRPHYWDPVLKMDLLCDSGSQVTAFPPDPGDREDKNVILRAVNGTKIKTYGYKEVSSKN